jgi:cellulose synthase/poly-beta-1,6-N-acetylglucosamine synthase-like glycosyltransferase
LDSFSLPAIFVLCSAVFYVAVQIGLIVGLFRMRKPTGEAHPFVSVIVAARNERRSINNLLKALLNQTYPNYEVIIVNDRSTDATAEIVRHVQESASRLKLVSIESILNELPPKKNALAQGIRASKGDILCFTDADCLPSKTWIESLLSFFDDGVGVVAGYSPYDERLLPDDASKKPSSQLLHRFIAGEEFKGAIWSAGAIGLNLAWLCTGRNLAYRRKAFDEVGGFEKIKMSISGDDDLFIQIVRRQTKWKIRYASSPDSFVRTVPPETFAKFVEQRTRHFSAGKYFTPLMKAFFFCFHLSNLVLFLGLFAAFFSTSLMQAGVIGFALKLGCDLFLMIVAYRLLLRESIWRINRLINFLLTEILYIFYNTFIGPLGFIKTFRWKQD